MLGLLNYAKKLCYHQKPTLMISAPKATFLEVKFFRYIGGFWANFHQALLLKLAYHLHNRWRTGFLFEMVNNSRYRRNQVPFLAQFQLLLHLTSLPLGWMSVCRRALPAFCQAAVSCPIQRSRLASLEGLETFSWHLFSPGHLHSGSREGICEKKQLALIRPMETLHWKLIWFKL